MTQANHEAQRERVVIANSYLDTFISKSFHESRVIFANESANASLKEFEKAAELLDETTRREILDAVDERESSSRGDNWHVFKSMHPELWDSFDKDAILRVALATEFEPPDQIAAICKSEFDTTDMYLWVLKRAKEGYFGKDALNTDLTNRNRRLALKYWYVFPDEKKREFFANGTVDDQFLEAMERLKEWEIKPLEAWKHKSFRQICAARISHQLGESANPRSFPLKYWQILSDEQKQQLADYGIVDADFLEEINQLESWVSGKLGEGVES